MSQGERLMARVRAHPRSMGPKIDSLLSPAQPLRLALVDPIGRYLRVWKSVDQLRVLSRFFFLLLPLLTAAFSTIIAKRKVGIMILSCLTIEVIGMPDSYICAIARCHQLNG
jgi:hypothetical protein